jgi:hypothetical protein
LKRKREEDEGKNNEINNEDVDLKELFGSDNEDEATEPPTKKQHTEEQNDGNTQNNDAAKDVSEIKVWF